MAFVALTTGEVDPNSPLDTNLFTKIKDNFDDHESRLLSVFAFGNNSIVDDFLGATGTTGVSTAVWDVGSTPGEEPVVASEHQCKMVTAAAADYSVISSVASKAHINLTQEYVAVLQMRVYKAAGTDDNFWFGWQDASLGSASSAIISTNLNRIGFYRDPAAASWKFETVNNGGGGGAATSVAGIGTSTSWGVYRLTVTCSGTAGNRQVKVEAGATEAALAEVSGSPFTNATGDLPTTVNLRPVLGVHRAGATNLDLRVDYCLAYTVGRPLAA